MPPAHLAQFVRDTVREQLDLSEILATYQQEERGHPSYHSEMMSRLLLYAYCQSAYSSHRIARACHERVDFMAVTGLIRETRAALEAGAASLRTGCSQDQGAA